MDEKDETKLTSFDMKSTNCYRSLHFFFIWGRNAAVPNGPVQTWVAPTSALFRKQPSTASIAIKEGGG